MLAAVILTLNEERHITDCINSVQWADQVVVFDSFSTDATPTLAQQAGAALIQHPFENYSQQRDAALQAVKADWVFFIDADERSTPESAEEIRRLLQHPDTKVGWWIPRHNYIFGHRMRGAGWWPDYQLRLLRREHATYDHKRAVHEVAVLEGEAGYLQAPLIHYNYETLQQFMEKQRRYTDYDVDILEEQGIPPRFYTPYRQGLHHFWWRFITLSGWRDGIYGITLSTLMAYYEMIKYKKLLERMQK
jgi:(heptosyl)LPS beta-1,4-glucosyltransferase